MALQSSGVISLANIQTEFSGANPIALSEYYRGGAYVPSTKITTQGPSYTYTSTSWAWADPAYLTINWAGATVFSSASQSGASTLTTKTAGGWTYTRQAYQGEVSANFFYSVSRSQSTIVNAGVPTSGTILLSNFYGATA